MYFITAILLISFNGINETQVVQNKYLAFPNYETCKVYVTQNKTDIENQIRNLLSRTTVELKEVISVFCADEKGNRI